MTVPTRSPRQLLVVVFPMHFWEDFQAAARFKALACADGYKDRIQEIHRRGEEFLV